MVILPRIVEAAIQVQSVLSTAGIRSCVIGGLAVQRWGEPRATADVDLSVAAPVGDEQAPIDLLLRAFRPRRPDARAFAIDRRVLLVSATNDVRVDVALAGSPFEAEVLDRASGWTVGAGLVLMTCSAEDLVLYKLIAARPGDLSDIRGIVQRQGRRLDVAHIRRYGGLFAEMKEDPDLLRPFEETWAQVER